MTCDEQRLKRDSGSSCGPRSAGAAAGVWRRRPLEELEKELSGLKVTCGESIAALVASAA